MDKIQQSDSAAVDKLHDEASQIQARDSCSSGSVDNCNIDTTAKTPDPRSTHEKSSAQRDDVKSNLLSKYLLEISFMFTIFPFIVLMIPQTDIFMKKSAIELHCNSSCWAHLNDTQKAALLVRIERRTKNLGLMRDLNLTILGTIVSMFAAQYMNRYGAKLPLLVSVCGSAAACAGDLFTFIDFSIPLEFNVVTVIPRALTGGISVFITTLYTNVTLTCPPEQRKKRFLMVQFFIFLSILLGTAAGGPVYEHFGLIPLTAVIATCFIISFSLIYFVYEDKAVSESAKQETFSQAWRHSTSLETFKQSVSYLVLERPGHARAQVYCMFACLLIGVAALSGISDLNQMYTKQMFHWDSEKYSYMSVVAMLAAFLLAIPTMIVMTKILKLKDTTLVATGFASCAAKTAIEAAYCLGEFMFFIQIVVGLPFIVGLISCRSHLSQLLQQHEINVIFALTSSSEQLFPVIYELVMTAVFNATNGWFLGFVYVVQAVTYLVPSCLALLCYRWVKLEGYPQYTDVNEAPLALGAERK